MAKKNQKLSNVIKKPLRVVRKLSGISSQELNDKITHLEQNFLDLNHHVHVLKKDFSELKESYFEGNKAVETVDQRIKILDDRLTDVFHQMTIMNENNVKPAASTKESVEKPSNRSELVADEHLLDNFYVHFERWFRGTEEEIAKRQSVYLPYFKESKIDSKKFPVIDIGCGNGEFVELLNKNGIRAIGLDLNKAMVDNVKKKGLEAFQGDALSYLRKQKSSSCMAITGFHIVEHIPFLDLVKIFNECYRVLTPGGFVIFETPNPENTIVGSCNFYNDPSHLHPLPPMFLELVMKTRGFPKNEVKRLHPLKSKIEHSDPLVKEMAQRFFGPQDYAIISHK